MYISSRGGDWCLLGPKQCHDTTSADEFTPAKVIPQLPTASQQPCHKQATICLPVFSPQSMASQPCKDRTKKLHHVSYPGVPGNLMPRVRVLNSANHGPDAGPARSPPSIISLIVDTDQCSKMPAPSLVSIFPWGESGYLGEIVG